MRRRWRWGAMIAMLALASACATGRAVRSAQDAAGKGDWDTAVEFYRQALGRDPGRLDLKIGLERAMRYASADHLKRAHDLELQDQLAGAAAEYQLAADLDPSNTQALQKANELQRRIRDQIEASRPKPSIDLLRDQAALQSTIPHLDPRVIVPSVNYPPPGAAVRDILKAIGDLTNINITYDQNLSPINNQYAFTVSNESLETVLNQVLSNNGLTFKVLNAKTIFVYQDTPAKRQQFEDTYYQTFPLSHVEANDMVQILTTMITQGTTVRPVITQNKSTNTIVVKATEPVLKAIQQIIASNDKPRAEVMVDVEILEVDRTHAKQLGLDLSNYALGFTLSPELAPPNSTGTFPPSVPPPINLNTVSHGVGINDVYMTVPTAQIHLLESDTKSKLLAKSQLRGREGQPLSLNLGENVPIPQTSIGAAAAGGIPTVPQTTFAYRQVGVNLSFTPRVTYSDEVILDQFNVEKSAVGPSINIAGEDLPTFLSRQAQTSMRLRDGESNMLAGLIQEEDSRTLNSFPGLMQIPILRSLFGNVNNTINNSDIVMIVTPHIIRSHELTPDDLKPMYVGTQQNFGAGTAPQLISPNAPPPPATGVTGGGAPPPPPGATTAAGGTTAGNPASAASTPPPAATPPSNPSRAVGIVPVEPVGSTGAPSPASQATIILTTPTAPVTAGGTPFTVPVTITDSSQIGSITLSVTYDPKLLHAASMAQGTFMQAGSATTTYVPKIDAQAGRIDVVISRPAGLPGASGTGLIVGIVFEPLTAGTARVNVSGAAQTASGQPVTLKTTPVSIVVK